MSAPSDLPSGSAATPSRSVIRLSPIGLLALCVGLVATSSWMTHRTCGSHPAAANPVRTDPPASPQPVPGELSGPWGDLVTLDIDIEQPEEYVSFEENDHRSTQWVFPGKAPGGIRELLSGCGFTERQVALALAPEAVTDSPTATLLRPPAELVIGLSPAVREKLYTVLAQWPENKAMATPYHLPMTGLGTLLASDRIPAEIRALVEQLSYVRGGHRYFSDTDLVLGRLPQAGDRLHLLKALTNQTAVMARLKLGPDSDIDKLLGYWGATPGVRTKDLRPLLESVRNAPQGGTISLLYLLPRFARERLYTFPLPQQAGDPKMDCHWTALNFFNDEPDDRLQDNAFASAHIKEFFYQIGKPSRCGDLVFITNPQGEVIHSAVYIAGDICFTKNGINFAQPWILMRMDRLSDVYTFADEPKMLYYRRKEA